MKHGILSADVLGKVTPGRDGYFHFHLHPDGPFEADRLDLRLCLHRGEEVVGEIQCEGIQKGSQQIHLGEVRFEL